jgi:N-acetylneuraminate synthase/N,N'-diacetyllegionaminate synthase
VSCYVIAEAGVNHNGDLNTALGLVEAAAAAGADAVKFQTFQAAEIAVSDAPKAAYQAERDKESSNQREMLRRLELDAAAHRTLSARCVELGIDFLSSPFGLRDLRLILDSGVHAIKLGSGEITNLPLLQAAGSSHLPVFLSTGMSSLGEVAVAVEVLKKAGAEITLMHCLSAYPAPPGEINLRAIGALADTFHVPVGFSDHSLGIGIAIAAAALGATVIEKHLTLDRTLPGPDHAASLEPAEFAVMVREIRNVVAALGDGIKRVMPSEEANRAVSRKSIVAARDLVAGELLAPDSLTTKRPGTGLSPMVIDQVLGNRLKHDVEADTLLSWSDF